MELSDKEQISKLLSKVDEKHKNSIDIDILDRQFSILNLPSQGHYYPDNTKSLLIRYLSAKEETVLTDELLMESGHALHLVLQNLIISDFDIDGLLAGDFHAISMFLRSNAYGNKIDLDVQCPHCSFENKVKLQLDTFKMKDIKMLPNDFGRVTCQLPYSKQMVSMRIPTFKDEMRFSRLNQENSLERIYGLIHSLDEEEDKVVIRNVMPNLPIRDMRFLKSFLEENTPGVDTSFVHKCENCDRDFGSSFNMGEGLLKLPSRYQEVVMNEVFLCHYYGKGITKENAEKMPAFHRSWTIRRIQEELDKKQKEEEKAQKRSSGKSSNRRGRG
jgi:hypothetical protein|tara:strand:- start:9119 stop:10108 length:990 start_codon:yes stop_codon:yes gene_type:complete